MYLDTRKEEKSVAKYTNHYPQKTVEPEEEEKKKVIALREENAKRLGIKLNNYLSK